MLKNINTALALATITITLSQCTSKDQVNLVVKNIDELVFASGQLEWDNNYTLTAQTDGVLENVDLTVGQTVIKGQTVGKINNANNDVNASTTASQLRIAEQNVSSNAPALLQLEQAINYAKSKYAQDKLMAERFERLYANGAASKVDLESRQLAAKNALSSLASLQKQYDATLLQAKQQKIGSAGQQQNSRILQQYNQLRVPASGTVLNTFKNTGDFVRRGEIIASIADKNKVKVVLNIDENSIAKVKMGQKVFIKLNTEAQTTYTAHITEIETAFNTQTQSFVCQAVLDTLPKTLFFGTQLEANILVGSKNKALLLPRSYVGFGNKVQVKGEDKPRVVKTGIISTDYVEILEGLKPTDVIIPLKP